MIMRVSRIVVTSYDLMTLGADSNRDLCLLGGVAAMLPLHHSRVGSGGRIRTDDLMVMSHAS